MNTDVDWPRVWTDVAERLRVDVARGLAHLVSESVLRWIVIETLASHGVGGDRIATEVLYAELPGARVDLVVDGTDVVELKMPHGSRVSGTPLTQHLGSLLADFQRVAVVPASSRGVVQVLPASIEAYLVRRTSFRWPLKPGDELTIEPALIAALPATAQGKALQTDIEARVMCTHAAGIGARFTFRAYRVD